MTTRADVQRVFDKLGEAATAHTLDRSAKNGERLLSLLRELEVKARAVGEEAVAQTAAENYKQGQALTPGLAHHDLGEYLNDGALMLMQRQFDS